MIFSEDIAASSIEIGKRKSDSHNILLVNNNTAFLGTVITKGKRHRYGSKTDPLSDIKRDSQREMIVEAIKFYNALISNYMEIIAKNIILEFVATILRKIEPKCKLAK